MINNLDIITPLLEFPHKDIFYFIQVLQRKKDHKGITLGGSNNNSRLIKAYFITSVDKLHKQWEEMTTLAGVFDARVMINLNPRNFRKAGYHLLQKIANSMANDDFYNLHRAYTSVCGEYHSEIDKRWIVDLDADDLAKTDGIVSMINAEYSINVKQQYRILATIPSKSGAHLICNPFNIQRFTQRFPTVEIHKNNPTNLYIP